MSKELIDRIEELLIINSALRAEIKDLKEMVGELLEEILHNREILDNKDYWR